MKIVDEQTRKYVSNVNLINLEKTNFDEDAEINLDDEDLYDVNIITCFREKKV